MVQGGDSTEVGAASFGVGIDLPQLARDLDRAEQLARDRATRIQGILGNIRVNVQTAGETEQTTTQRVRTRRARVVVEAPPPPPPRALAIIEQRQIIRVRQTLEIIPPRPIDIARATQNALRGLSRNQPALGAPFGGVPLGSRTVVQRLPSGPFDPRLFGGAPIPVTTAIQRAFPALPSGGGRPQLALPAPAIPGLGTDRWWSQWTTLNARGVPPGRVPGQFASALRDVQGLPPAAGAGSFAAFAASMSGGGAPPTPTTPQTAQQRTQATANNMFRQAIRTETTPPDRQRIAAIRRQISVFLGVAPSVTDDQIAAEQGLTLAPLPGAAPAGSTVTQTRPRTAVGQAQNQSQRLGQLLTTAGVSPQIAGQFLPQIQAAQQQAAQTQSIVAALRAAGVQNAQANKLAAQIAQAQAQVGAPGAAAPVPGGVPVPAAVPQTPAARAAARRAAALQRVAAQRAGARGQAAQRLASFLAPPAGVIPPGTAGGLIPPGAPAGVAGGPGAPPPGAPPTVAGGGFAGFARRAFQITPANILRAAGALTGIGVGLSIMASVAHRVHNEIAAVVTDVEELSRAGRALGTTVGPGAGRRIVGGAGGFDSDRNVRGTSAAYIEAAQALATLNTQYGISDQQITSLLSSSGQLVRIYGVGLPQAANALKGALTGNATAAQELGLNLIDEGSRLRSVGLTFDQLAATVGRAKAQQQVYADIQKEVVAAQERARLSTNATADALDSIGKQADRARDALVHLTEKPFEVVVRTIAQVANAPSAIPEGVARAVERGAEGAFAVFTSAISGKPDQLQDFLGRQIASLQTYTTTLQSVAQANTTVAATQSQIDRGQRGFTAVIDTATQSVNRQVSALDKFAVANARVAASESFAISRTRIGQAESVLGALEGPTGIAGASTDRLRLIAQERTLKELEQRSLANDATNQVQSVNPKFTSPAEQAAFSRQILQTQAEREQAQGGIAANIAQARIDVLSAQSDLRRLNRQQELNDLQRTTIQLQDQMAPALLKQAEIQDRITVNNRENLDLVERRVRAEIAGLPASRALEDINFGEQQATLQATSAIIDEMQGGGPANIDEQINRIIAAEFQKPRAELGALNAQRGVTEADRAAQDDALRRQLAGVPLTRAQRAGEDVLIPAQAAERLARSQADAIERSLQSGNLAQGPERIQAEKDLADARLRQSEAAEQIAQVQAEAAGITIYQSYTIPAGTEYDAALIEAMNASVSSATIEAINRARDSVGRRVPVTTAAGR